jgi:hypothetical protein
MDTRFWGPSGWRLLHLITFTYDPLTQKEHLRRFFTSLPYVLPCKFCRASLTEYYEIEPLEPALESKQTLSKWLYRIHNHVNEKLRKQNLCNEPNPSFASVKKVYSDRISAGCTHTEFEGWDFLFSIAENHPFSQAHKHSSPMPNMPSEPIHTLKEKNRWNTLDPKDRMPMYRQFWESIGHSLPFSEWRKSWIDCHPRLERFHTPGLSKKELWRIRCCLEKRLQLINREQYNSLCKRLESHTSGCNSTKRAKTCRAKKKHPRQTVKTHRKR